MEFDTTKTLPTLTPIEIRVLGVLIEKCRVTPDYYPMTLNAITMACNQKSSRKPIVNYEDELVLETLQSLKTTGLVSTAIGGGSRTIKYKHNFNLEYETSIAELCVMCLLFLRGPLTAGEINSNSTRFYDFDSIEEVVNVLIKLSELQLPFVKELPKRAGQKESRFTHLFTEFDESQLIETVEETSTKTNSEIENRLTQMETEIAELKDKVNMLIKELGL